MKRGWISSSFGGFEDTQLSEDKSKNRKQTEIQRGSDRVSHQDETLWLDRYKPKSELELAVHKKKIAEVRDWLRTHFCTKVHGSGSGSILLLTGPAGAGKTTTLEVLSQEIGFEIQEWINPITNASFEGAGEYQQRSFVTFESQVKKFQDFILRANKYPTLSIFAGNNDEARQKIILVEDFPNIFFRDPGQFHEVLRVYKQTGRSPLVFIVSDSHYGDSNVYRLMPKDLQASLNIHNISYNPVAHTSLVKAMNRVVSLESNQGTSDFSHPSKEVIEDLSHNSAGDIRAAINALQFTCLKDKSSKTRKRQALTKSSKTSKVVKISKKGKPSDSKSYESEHLLYGKDSTKAEQDTQAAIGGKDASLFLFRALGKILYCKRDTSLSDKDSLPEHLHSMARNQLQFTPEDVIEKTHLSGDSFNLYLHQNYLLFFSDIEDVCIATEYMSDANMMTSEWMHRLTLQEYPPCLATRGLAFSNHTKSATGSGGWRPLHKPQWFDIFKRMRDNCSAMRDLFRGYGSSAVVMQTEVLPYLALTDLPLKTPGQISFLQSVCRLTKRRQGFRSFTETLDEKDLGREDEDDVLDSQEQSAPPQIKSAKGMLVRHDSAEECITARLGVEEEQVVELDEEEDVIEDFDDG